MATAWRTDAQHVPVSPAAGRPLHVLVVEDNPDCALSLTMILRHNGFAVDVATTGPAALASIQTSSPDVVLMDIALPEMDGFEVAERLRDLPGKKPLLIALTGYGREADRQRSREEGFAYHFVKPADPLEIVALLNDHARSLSPIDAAGASSRRKWKSGGSSLCSRGPS